jgi:hypothetical protein
MKGFLSSILRYGRKIPPSTHSFGYRKSEIIA